MLTFDTHAYSLETYAFEEILEYNTLKRISSWRFLETIIVLVYSIENRNNINSGKFRMIGGLAKMRPERFELPTF